MVQMIDVKNGAPPGVAAFYDWLAPEYDAMTGFAKRFVHEKPFFRMLIECHGIRTAVDAGCGTGFHSLLLAQLGVSVTAVDVSGDMLAGVQRHAGDLPIHPLRSSFRDLRSVIKHPVDAVFCMGNTLAHLLSAKELGQSLAAFAAVLRPGGILFAQNLNFERILAVRECVQSIREADDVTFVRFYDYEGDRIRFSILRVSGDPEVPDHSLNSVLLRPIPKDELEAQLARAGFGGVKAFGGITMEEYNPATSRDLVILAFTKES